MKLNLPGEFRSHPAMDCVAWTSIVFHSNLLQSTLDETASVRFDAKACSRLMMRIVQGVEEDQRMRGAEGGQRQNFVLMTRGLEREVGMQSPAIYSDSTNYVEEHSTGGSCNVESQKFC